MPPSGSSGQSGGIADPPSQLGSQVVPVLGQHLHTDSSPCCSHHFWEGPQEGGCEPSKWSV